MIGLGGLPAPPRPSASAHLISSFSRFLGVPGPKKPVLGGSKGVPLGGNLGTGSHYAGGSPRGTPPGGGSEATIIFGKDVI